MRDYRECTYCVMDTSDPAIEFDADGRCHHCLGMEQLIGSVWKTGEEGRRRLQSELDRVRAYGEGKEFDCIIGLSGGIDSSYLAMKAHEWGLRPLVVHVDGGWNTELAVQNIERVVEATGFELHTHVVDWDAMRRLQLAYLRSGVANQDVPQDHAFFSALYRFATDNGIRYVLNGFNVATEGIFPKTWQGPAMDARSLRAIHRRYGEGSLRGYPTVGMFRYYAWYPLVKRMTPVNPLNSMDYHKDAAVQELSRTVGWRPYPRKHGESVWTKFFQNHYLPTRFGYDKRRPHLSSLITSHQLDRDRALELLAQPLYDPDELAADIEYVCRKLRISAGELQSFLEAPLAYYEDLPNWRKTQARILKVKRLAERAAGRPISVYEK